MEEFDVQLSSGWVRAARLSASGPLVLCLPGLSASLRSFDVIGHRLADAGFHVVANQLNDVAESGEWRASGGEAGGAGLPRGPAKGNALRSVPVPSGADAGRKR